MHFFPKKNAAMEMGPKRIKNENNEITKYDWFPKVKNSLADIIPVMFGQTLQGCFRKLIKLFTKISLSFFR